MGYSPQGRKASDTTERLHFTSLLFFNEGTRRKQVVCRPREEVGSLPQAPNQPHLELGPPSPRSWEKETHPARGILLRQQGGWRQVRAFSDHVSH